MTKLIIPMLLTMLVMAACSQEPVDSGISYNAGC